MLKKEFDYKLLEGFEFQNLKSQKIETANTLTLIAPSIENDLQRITLQHSLMRAISDVQSKTNQNQIDTKTPQEALSGEMIFMLISMSSLTVKEKKECYDAFIELITNGLCKVNGVVSLTYDLFRKISPDDIDCMMGEYIANFLIPSGMKQMMKN